MDSTVQVQDWIRRSHTAITPEAEAALLDDLLNAEIEQTAALEVFASTWECRSVFRCAALDQYVKHKQIDAEMFLDFLTGKQETNDLVRLAAYQWLFELAEKYTSTLRSPEGEADWTVRLRNDPSPRVRWLAAAGRRPPRK